MNAKESFLKLMKANRNGENKGIYSICSAQRDVIKAGIIRAKYDNSILLIESTSNQVDQNGGYTGMTPDQFVSYVNSLADETGLDRSKILFGGDHLGPNFWQNLPAEEAMANSHILIREYIKAGYLKIHLDASMFLADDTGERGRPLADEIVSARAAALCRTAEETWKEFRASFPKPVYIIGTEVPIPGGAREEEDHVEVTLPQDALKTVEVTKAAFLKLGLEDAWSRVTGVVVQPGVEFGDDQVFDYNRKDAAELTGAIDKYPHLVFEAHSTDYQTEEGLTRLVEDHFCILKVGPWLTFAYREALFALAEMEKELYSDRAEQQSGVREKLEEVMLADPKYWKKYYPGSEKEKMFKRKFSFSDRSRYYWPNKNLQHAVKTLYSNLEKKGISLSLLSQYMPNQYTQVRSGKIKADPGSLIMSRISEVLGIYSRACGLGR